MHFSTGYWRNGKNFIYRRAFLEKPLPVWVDIFSGTCLDTAKLIAVRVATILPKNRINVIGNTNEQQANEDLNISDKFWEFFTIWIANFEKLPWDDDRLKIIKRLTIINSLYNHYRLLRHLHIMYEIDKWQKVSQEFLTCPKGNNLIGS